MASSDCLWELIMPELLAEIVSYLPFEERLGTAPLVCKAWKAAAYDPICWRVVNMDSWFRKRVEEDYWWEFKCETKVEFLVKKVVDISGGQLRELHAMHCTDSAIEHVALSCPDLEVLCISSSFQVANSSALLVATKCTKLKQLDVSDCPNIDKCALEAFGRNCKSLVSFSRNMLQHNDIMQASGSIGGDEEVMVVSKHMVKLKSLELKRTTISDQGLTLLAKGCLELEYLNLACCTALSPRALDFVSRTCQQLKKFTRPIVPRMQVVPDFYYVLV